MRIRAYSKKELAVCLMPELSPDCARRNLRHWIINNARLHAELSHLGYSAAQNMLTPAQVETIVKYVGTCKDIDY